MPKKGEKNPNKREGPHHTFRLLPADKKLIQQLAHGRKETPDRYTALRALVDFVGRPPQPDEPPGKDRDPIRVQIPAELQEAILAEKKRTGRPYVHILLEAAQRYRDKYPNTGASS